MVALEAELTPFRLDKEKIVQIRQEMFQASLLCQDQKRLEGTVEVALLAAQQAQTPSALKGMEMFAKEIAEYAQDLGFDIRTWDEPEVFDDPNDVCEYEQVLLFFFLALFQLSSFLTLGSTFPFCLTIFCFSFSCFQMRVRETKWMRLKKICSF